MADQPERRQNPYLVTILATGSLAIAAVIVIFLLIKPIPDRNETLVGTIIGFIFGNMIGPVFRTMFNQQQDDASKRVTDKALDALASSQPPEKK